MFIVWAGSFTRHEMYMHEVESYVADFNAEKKRLNTWTSDLRVTLPTLNALAKASIVYDQEEHPWLSGLGMYDSNVDDAADLAYETQLRNFFLPKVIKYVELYLKRGHRGGDLYSSFRTYVMFNKLEHMDKQLVLDWFASKWKEEYEGQATYRQQLTAHLQALLNLELQPSELDKHVLASTRNLLLRVPVSKRIYERIRTNPQYTQRIDLLNAFGESVRDTYLVNPKVMTHLSIPLLFTKDAYDNIDFSPESKVLSSIVNERWLLAENDKARVDFVQDDLDEVSHKVKQHYLAEYNTYWNNVYNVLDIKPFKNIQHANDVLTVFTDPVYSPLLAILQVGANNTQLTNQLAANMADDHDEGITGKVTGFAASKANLTRVDKQFRPINVLLRESSKRPAPISTVLMKVSQLQAFVNEINLAPDPYKKAFDVAKVRYQSGAGNAISSLRAYAKTTPDPIKRWLSTLADESWRVILSAAHRHVASEWRTRVYGPYVQSLSGRYPLRANAQDEAALLDFIEFFKPGGTIDVFHQEYIKPFINTRRGWSNRGIDNYSLGLSHKTIKQVRTALSIKNIFFRTNPEVPSLTFKLKPHFMRKNDARFTLEVGSTRLSYSHGPKFWKTLNWSAADDQNRVRIIFEDLNNQQHSKTFEGPWAWFRLLDQSELSKTTSSNVYLVSYVISDARRGQSELSPMRTLNEHKITYQIKTKSIHNPLQNNLLSSFRCPERI
jgi:type VI secretion system protein ImpL